MLDVKHAFMISTTARTFLTFKGCSSFFFFFLSLLVLETCWVVFLISSHRYLLNNFTVSLFNYSEILPVQFAASRKKLNLQKFSVISNETGMGDHVPPSQCLPRRPCQIVIWGLELVWMRFLIHLTWNTFHAKKTCLCCEDFKGLHLL